MVIAGATVVVDDDAATRADGQHALAGQLIARADAGREHDHVGLVVAAIFKDHAVAVLGPVHDFHGATAGEHVHTQRLDLVAQDATTALVHLHGHQARRELDHMGLQAQVAQGLGAFQAQQAAAHHHAGARFGARHLHGLQVFNGAVHKALVAVAPGNGGHEGGRAGGQHQLVVRQHLAIGGGDGAVAALDGHGASSQAQREAGALEEAGLDHGQVFGRFAGEEFREVHPVIGRARFFAQHGDFSVLQARFSQAFQKLVTHHAVANDDDFHMHSCDA